MKRSTLIPIVVLMIIALMAGIGMTLSLLSPGPVAAQATTDSLRTIQVSGRGEVTAEPDEAVIRLGVETEADTAQQAVDANNEQMTAVISATLESGIEEANIRTEGFRLQPVYESPEDGQGAELTGYRVSNTASITVRDLAQLGDLLDAAVAAGSNTIEGIQFIISNQAELESAARDAAMADAQQKAEQLTELSGAQLGPVHTILETGIPSPLSFNVTQEEALGTSTPIQPGTQTIEATIQVTWEIQ